MSLRVLAVDDDPSIRSMHEMLLMLEGYEVRVAEHGQAGLDVARAWRPDVIVCDVMMPVMDGIEMLRQVNADPDLRTIPVIMVTAKTADADTKRGYDEGAAGYIPKPFEAEHLVAEIERAAAEASSAP